MNFLTMKQELADRLSSFDQTVAEDDTRLGRWINLAQQEIGGQWNWPFLWAQDIIQTSADYTTGTVSINSGSASLSFSVAPSVSFVDRYIQFAGEDEWYRITVLPVGTTSATIDPPYGGTANLTGSTFVVRKVYYGLDSTISGVADIKIAKDRAFLNPMQRLTMINLGAFLDTSGTPTAYYLEIPDADGLPQIAFYPTPDETLNVFVRGKKEMTDLSLITDTSIIPTAYHAVVLDLASYYGFSKLNNLSMATNAYNKYEKGLATMKSVYSQDIGRLRVMGAVDDETPDGSIELNLPRNVTAP